MRALGRWLLLVVVAALALQLFFIGRIAWMALVDPQSTAFQRSEAWRLATSGQLRWRQDWRDYDQISDHLKRAVIASEDDDFVNHEGVDWEAIDKAWERNAKAEEAAAQRAAQNRPVRPVKIRGGSTITQQLAKNLLLSGERTLLRKGQELVLTFALEHLLSKRRMGRRRVWRRGGVAALFPQERGATQRVGSRAPGRHAAAPALLRAAAALGLPE